MPASNKFAKDILLDCFMLDSRLYSIKKYKLFMSYFINILKEAVKPYHLLQHPFYQKWNKGVLNKKVLQEYSKQYFHHVEAFPRCISAIHSNCTELENRLILLGNLMEEEDKEIAIIVKQETIS